MRISTQSTWRRFTVGLAAALFAGAAVSAVASAAHADPPAAPVIAQSAQTPTPTPAGNLVAQGRARFDRQCGRCHPGGEEDVGPRVTGINWTPERMTHQIRSGGGRMRAIPPARLPDADLPALMAYLRTIHAVR